MSDVQAPLTKLKGIGPSKAALFQKVGVNGVDDLLEYYPRGYLDQSARVTVQEALSRMEEDREVLILAKVVSDPKNFHKGRFTVTTVRIEDESGSVEAVWFNQPYLIKNLVKEETYLFSGKLRRNYNRNQLTAPKLQRVEEAASIPALLPLYPLCSGLSQKTVRSAVKQALEQLKEEDSLPPGYRQNMLSYPEAIRAIHQPDSLKQAETARERLAFDELFIMQMAMRERKLRRGRKASGSRLAGDEEKEEAFIRSLSFTMTGAQRRSWEEIKEDMASDRAMSRLLQGDVGCGKTLIAFLSMYRAYLSGYQSALMAPTEVLAGQHLKEALRLLEPLGMRVALLTGNVQGRERQGVLEGLKDGSIHGVIGTHALFSDPVTWQNLGLVITDEQHRFGVRQRMNLTRKGEETNVLVMSATPIPRTLAMILYGDMDISAIDEMPPGRTPVKTFAVDTRYEERLYAFMRKHVAEGHQVYVICPMVEEADKKEEEKEEPELGVSVSFQTGEEREDLPLRSAVGYADFLQRIVFPDLSVGLIHGKMHPREKDNAMNAFADGRIDILVSTTVVEVGVNVPNATLMVIENAERFGLAQLHQLRGRVGRGKTESQCVLVSDSRQPQTRQRLNMMVHSNDGFRIAEEDLRLRGSGDLWGLRQHGLPDFRVADLSTDIELLKAARDLAETVIQADPELTQLEHRGIADRLERFWNRVGTDPGSAD